MNSKLIRERWQRNTRPFLFRLTDGSRVQVPHPDFMAMPPGLGAFIVFDKSGGEIRIDPLHVVAIEESTGGKSKANGKRSR